MPSSQHGGGHERGSKRTYIHTTTAGSEVKEIGRCMRTEAEAAGQRQTANGEVCGPCKPIVACLACIDDTAWTDWMAKSRHRPSAVSSVADREACALRHERLVTAWLGL
jgi:hypothetical protein